MPLQDILQGHYTVQIRTARPGDQPRAAGRRAILRGSASATDHRISDGARRALIYITAAAVI